MALSVNTILVTIPTKRTAAITIITIFIYSAHCRIIALTSSNGTN